MKSAILTACFTLSIFSILSQELEYSILKTNERITIDGILDEAIWRNNPKIKDFAQKFPDDQGIAKTKTEVIMTYDDEAIYVAAICHDGIDKDYVIQSLKRDFSFPVSDAFAVFINPTADMINGFSFAVNPYGAQREGTLDRGGVYGVTTAWDNIWYSAVKRMGDRWVAELKIPFTSIRYDKDITTWKINFARNDLKRNETSTWARMPVNQNVANLSFTGNLKWPQGVPKAGLNIAFIPYSSTANNINFQSESRSNAVQSGMDAKIAITPNLNLDLTLNPDFSQVDIDAQQINLTQFNLFFPERRKFFIENADLFAQFGFSRIRPFYSRRIGQSSTIQGGARLSGKLDENWRVGLMNMQSGIVTRISQNGDTTNQEENYTVASVQRRIGKASDLGIILLNHTGTGAPIQNTLNWNRIAGIEYNLASKDRAWVGEAFIHKSFQPGNQDNSITHASYLRYQNRDITVAWNHEYVGENYTALLGFVPRQNWRVYDPEIQRYYTEKLSYWRLEPSIEYSFYPESKILFKHGPRVYYSDYMDENFETTDKQIIPVYGFQFLEGSYFGLAHEFTQRRLLYPFYISGTDEAPIEVGTYNFQESRAEFVSNKRKKFYYQVNAGTGSFIVGTKKFISGAINYRIQPWGILSTNFTFNDIQMPEPYTSTQPTLVGAKAELSFTKEIFFTSFLQYNTQIDNFNVYTRLQYRFKPMSDFFIVYSNNYDLIMDRKNSSLVLKFVYWLNS